MIHICKAGVRGSIPLVSTSLTSTNRPRRGRSLQVIVYVGLDPLTGKKLYLRESTTDEAEAGVFSDDRLRPLLEA